MIAGAVVLGTAGIGAPAVALLTVAALVALNKVHEGAHAKSGVRASEIEELESAAEVKDARVALSNHAHTQGTRLGRAQDRKDAFEAIQDEVKKWGGAGKLNDSILKKYVELVNRDTASIKREVVYMADGADDERAKATVGGAKELVDELYGLMEALSDVDSGNLAKAVVGQIKSRIKVVYHAYNEGIAKYGGPLDDEGAGDQGAPGVELRGVEQAPAAESAPEVRQAATNGVPEPPRRKG